MTTALIIQARIRSQNQAKKLAKSKIHSIVSHREINPDAKINNISRGDVRRLFILL